MKKFTAIAGPSALVIISEIVRSAEAKIRNARL